MGTVFLTGFFTSLMFPTIYALDIKGLGANSKEGGAFIIMAITGGAAAPPAMGLLDRIWHSMAVAIIIPLICYAVATLYAHYDSRMRVAQTESAAASEPVMP